MRISDWSSDVCSSDLVLVGIAILGRTSPAQARLLEGLITGVGFIGGGAILKKDDKASGTATAASLWATGAPGAAVGYGLYDIAFILSDHTFLPLPSSLPPTRSTNHYMRRHAGARTNHPA